MSLNCIKLAALAAVIALVSCSKLDINDPYYYVEGEKIYLDVCKDMVYLEFKGDEGYETFMEYLKEDPFLEPWSYDGLYGHQVSRSFFVFRKGSISRARINALKKREEITHAAYVFGDHDRPSSYRNQFIVSISDPADYIFLHGLVDKFGFELKFWHKYTNSIENFVIVPEDTGKDAFDMANYFYETGKFRYSSPDFVFTRAFD